MNEIEYNFEVNESLAGETRMKVTPKGRVVHTFYVSQLEMNEIAWHVHHIHEEHPDWEPHQVFSRAVMNIVKQSEKNANKMNENGTN